MSSLLTSNYPPANVFISSISRGFGWKHLGGGRADERDTGMMELMSQEALRLGADRRREVALETMREVHAADSVRRTTGAAIVALGQRVTGEIAGRKEQLRTTGDCA